MKEEDLDYSIKVVIIGDTEVGKTSIMLRFTDDFFDENQPTTIGVDFQSKVITFKSKKVKLFIWDTAGNERYRTLSSPYYRDAICVVCVYDVSRHETFDNIATKWQTEVLQYLQRTDYISMLIGNKSDLDDREVTLEEGKAFAEANNYIFLETSAKYGDCVEEAFLNMLSKVFENPRILQSCAVEKSRSNNRSNSSQKNVSIVNPSTAAANAGGGCC